MSEATRVDGEIGNISVLMMLRVNIAVGKAAAA
jgi:hypothetical protein